MKRKGSPGGWRNGDNGGGGGGTLGKRGVGFTVEDEPGLEKRKGRRSKRKRRGGGHRKHGAAGKKTEQGDVSRLRGR